MTSQGDGSTNEPSLPSSLPHLDIRKTRSPTRDDSSDASTASLPLRTQSPALSSRATTFSNVLSRSSSPNGRLSLSLARFGRNSTSSPLSNVADSNDETRSLIVRAFSPTVAVCASPETDDLARQKGFKKGFATLLEPYGENITGKVVVRDSVGASRSWEDFGIRFLDLKSLISDATAYSGPQVLDNLEDLVEQYLDQSTGDAVNNGLHEISPYFRLYLARLLSSQPLAQHEAFAHPVATVIAISSSTPSPIETLRNLYSQTAQGALAMPPFANPEYLRYYLLIHDDDNDDFAKSSALFDQMKRHFGLHCHLLRLRSQPCTSADDDAEDVPESDWLSASTHLSKLQETTQLLELDEDTIPQIFATDAAAIRLLVRELVVQSIVPYMEQRIAVWNEQIASKRRGLSGRFMSLSKRWGGIGSLSSSRTSSATNLGGSTSGNYDNVQGQYRWDATESLLRKMADFAMMLRDYKLAASTYEMLRSDYSNDKAWKYLAGANEMCTVATLLNPLLSSSTASSSSSSSKSLPKLETFDTMLETASYSYLQRCNEPAYALRSLLLGVELLKVRGRLASELASKWAIRILELNLVPPSSNSHILVSERIASCLTGQLSLLQRPPTSTSTASTLTPTATYGPTSSFPRKRKAALWLTLTAEEWMKQGRPTFASARLDEAQELYSTLPHADAINSYKEMSLFMRELQLSIRLKLGGGQGRKRGISGASATGHLIEPNTSSAGNMRDPLMGTRLGGDGAEDSEVEDQDTTVEKIDARAPQQGHGHGHRRTMTADIVPLSPVRTRGGDPFEERRRDDDFEES